MSAAEHLDGPEWLFHPGPESEPEPIYVDRSTLERYAECPAQGAMVERGESMTASPEADAGSEVHAIIAEATRMAAEGDTAAADVRAYVDHAIQHSRPDVQPEVIEGLRRSSYALVSTLFYRPNGEPRHWEDIIAFDGGTGEKRGQRAWDVCEHDGRPVRLTNEFDLLMAADSDEEMNLYDYKSGRKFWSPTDIRQSFQFGTFYSWMAFVSFPKLQRLHVRIWNTRINQLTGRVTFSRKHDFLTMQGRIESSVATYLKHRKSEDAPAWPAASKCAMCDAAALCPEARGEVREVVKDPEAAARQLLAMEESVKALRKSLASYTDEHGPIRVDDRWFGRDLEPKAPKRKPSAAWHAASDESDEESE